MGFSDAILDTSLGTNLARFKDRHFLDAAMAASAMVAMADAHVSLSEQIAVDSVLENIERLNIFEPNKAVALHRQYVEAMVANSGEGEDKALTAIGRFRGDTEAAQLLMCIARYTALADQNLGNRERMAIRRLCRELDIDSEQCEKD